MDFNQLSSKQESDIVFGLMSEDPSMRGAVLKLIYKDYFPRVESFVIKNKGDRFDAKDVFQEGVMILYQNIKKNKFRGDSSLFTYTYSICRNIWYQRLQHPLMKITDSIDVNGLSFENGKSDRVNFKTLKIEGNELSSEYVQEEEINVQLLKKVMAGLKEDCKKMLVGFYYESKSMEELSFIFELGSTQAAKNKKSRCLKYLAKMMSEKGLTYKNFIG